MTALEKVIAKAREFEGYLEKSKVAYQTNPNCIYDKTSGAGRDNITLFWEKTRPSFQGQPWCQDFIVYCFLDALGKTDAKKALYLDDWYEAEPWTNYYTPDWAQNFKDHNAWCQTSKVQVGYLVYFRNSTRIHHVGLVIDVTRDETGYGYLTTIEGNTNSESGVVDNGGAVRIKKYRITPSGIECVAGYGIPNYIVCESNDDTLPTISKGYKDSERGTTYCAEMQMKLNLLGMTDYDGNPLAVDGSCGGKSVQAITRFQAVAQGMGIYDGEADGVCGAKTWKAIEDALKKDITTGTAKRSIIVAEGETYTIDSTKDGYVHLAEVDVYVPESVMLH